MSTSIGPDSTVSADHSVPDSKGKRWHILISDYPDSMMASHDMEIALLRQALEGPEAGETARPVDVEVYAFQETARVEFTKKLAWADAVLTAFTPINAGLLLACPRLKIISLNATGYDNVDLNAATQCGVGVSPVGEYCTHDVAEYTLALLLALLKNLKHYGDEVSRREIWSYSSVRPNPRLSDLTVAIFGLGRIGRAVASKLQSLKPTVIAHDPYVDPALAAKLGVALVSKEEALARGDVISNHMKLDTDTRAYFGADEFAAMARHPYFLNLGRGLSVDEEALATALDEGRVSGAGLDVLTDETPRLKQHCLNGRDNVIITPHAAFYTTSAVEDLQRISVMNIAYFLRGETEKVFRLVNNPDRSIRRER
ncbi:MAG: C-terminal binding protein [Actinomycetes bacterium]|nr:C-terminal binding protein [Actinomycetes bacterium]